MFTRRKLIFALSLALSLASAEAGPLLYVVTLTGQFGVVNPSTGAFQQIGPTTMDPLGGLVQRRYQYVGISISGNLDAVRPATGSISLIGPTGLGSNALDTAELNGQVYATDFSNNLYTIDTETGAATLIGYTGIPPAPTETNVVCDEALFSANRKLYASFDAFNVTTLAVVIPPELYEIDPATGGATPIAPTSLHLNAAVEAGGTVYAFQAQLATFTSDVLTLDLATGNTTLLAPVNSAAAPIDGAAVARRLKGDR